MDKRIIILIAVFFVGSLSFFLYRKLYYRPEGIRYTIRPNGVIHASDSILYQDKTPGANRWKWDFGDGEFSSEQSGQHLYLSPGQFTVSLSVYGPFGVQHDDKTVVSVLPSNIVVAATEPSISGPSDAQAGQAIQLSATAPAASYEWKVEGDPAMANKYQKGMSANYTFIHPGSKTIVLTMHNPDRVLRKSVTIAAIAPQPKPIVAAQPPRPVAAKPHQPSHPAHSKGNGLPEIGDGVEYKK